jgi:hypothetical protein
VSFEPAPLRADVEVVRAAPFWLAAVGGVLLAAASVAGSRVLELLGGALFALGVVAFFGVAVRRSRSEGIRLRTSVGRSARDALRFAWQLMP